MFPLCEVKGVSIGYTVTNFSQDWEVAEISTETQYKAGAKKGIHADIGVHIGLRGINITLKGNNSAMKEAERTPSSSARCFVVLIIH